MISKKAIDPHSSSTDKRWEIGRNLINFQTFVKKQNELGKLWQIHNGWRVEKGK